MKNEEERWAEIRRGILDIDHLPYGSPDINDPNEIMAIKAGYKCYADYLRDIEAFVKMKESGEL